MTATGSSASLPMVSAPARRTPAAAASPLESTLSLLTRVREGDETAWDTLIGRYLHMLRRVVHARLPCEVRGMTDTEDVIQDVLIKAVRQIGQFEVRREGALWAYLRQAVINKIADEIRKHRRRPAAVLLESDYPEDQKSPLEHAIAQENVDRYRAALALLRARDRQAIVLRLEQHLTYEELAARLVMPTPNAARVASIRALCRLAEVLANQSRSPAAVRPASAAAQPSRVAARSRLVVNR